MVRIWINILLAFCVHLPAQDIDWGKSNAWILFACSSQGAGDDKVSDSLGRCDSAALDMDTIHAYLTGITQIAAERSAGAAWMGAYWARCKVAGSVRLIKISTYGGFFVDQQTGLYYELPRPQRQAWLHYLREQVISLRQKNDSHGAGGG